MLPCRTNWSAGFVFTVSTSVCHVRTCLIKPYQIVFVIHAGLVRENIHASRRIEMYD